MRQSNSSLVLLYIGVAGLSACRAENGTRDSKATLGASSEGRPGTPSSALTTADLADAGRPIAPAATSPESSPERAATRLHIDDTATDDGGANHYADCYEGFAAGVLPEVDVMKLGLLCGPSNGMVERPERYDGLIDETGAEGRHVLRVRRDECFRAVASSEAAVDDLEMEIRETAGDSRALTNLDAHWAVAPENAPLCVKHDGSLELRVRTHGGRGRYVLRLWTFP